MQFLPGAGQGPCLRTQTVGLATGVYTLRLQAGPAPLAKRVVVR